MLFKLTNKNSDRMTHCGVLEFVADEGICYLPHWVSGAVLVSGESVSLSRVGPQAGTPSAQRVQVSYPRYRVREDIWDILFFVNCSAGSLDTTAMPFTCDLRGKACS